MLDPEKKKVLDTAVSQIEKQFGKGAIMKMDDTTRPLVPVISSGNIALDIALGTGGYPVGRIVEIFGPESSGKTTLALHSKRKHSIGYESEFDSIELKHTAKTRLGFAKGGIDCCPLVDE